MIQMFFSKNRVLPQVKVKKINQEPEFRMIWTLKFIPLTAAHHQASGMLVNGVPG